MADKTYSDLLTEVNFIHNLETSEASSANWLLFYARKANDAISIINDVIGGYEVTWETADLTVSGNEITFPDGFISEEAVWLDKIQQEYRTPEDLDYYIGDWRTDTSVIYGYYTKEDGKLIISNGSASIKIIGYQEIPFFPENADWDSTTTYGDGDLVTYNWKVYESLQAANTNKNPVTQTAWWSEVEDCPNPLSYLPKRHQGLPAQYILSEIPVTGENALEMNRQKKASDNWNAGLDTLSDAMRAKRNQQYGGI